MGLDKKTCLRGMADGGRPMSKIRGICMSLGPRRGAKFGPREFSAIRRGEVEIRGLDSGSGQRG